MIWADLSSSNSLATRYIRSEQFLELLARVTSGGTAAWFLVDRSQSIRNLVDNTGTLIDTIAYDGYGNIVTETNPSVGGAYRYNGYRYDAETGLYRPDATVGRYYTPQLGKWGGRDPIGFGSNDVNLYRYVRNNPVNWVDALGLFDPGTGTIVGVVGSSSSGAGGGTIAIGAGVGGLIVVEGGVLIWIGYELISGWISIYNANTQGQIIDAQIQAVMAAIAAQQAGQAAAAALAEGAGQAALSPLAKAALAAATATKTVKDICPPPPPPRRKKKKKDECKEKYDECNDSSLVRLPGSVYGESRCLMCFDACKRTGEWPDKLPVIRNGRTVYWTCDYKNSAKRRGPQRQ